MKVIFLTAADVAQLAPAAPPAALAPVATADPQGFILGTGVLSDPAHAANAEFLATLPLVDYDTIVFPEIEEPA